jgi:hypothetical protein
VRGDLDVARLGYGGDFLHPRNARVGGPRKAGRIFAPWRDTRPGARDVGNGRRAHCAARFPRLQRARAPDSEGISSRAASAAA